MSTIIEIIGERIRTYRLKSGMTQEALAEKAELHHTYIGQIERGERNLSVTVLEKILAALDVSFAELFQYMEPNQKEESIPAKCYELINRRDLVTQERIYRILCELDEMIGNK